jgi:ubiquitin C-terminal hydrolase
MSKSVVVVELREQLLVRERGLDEWEDALLAKEHGVVEAKRALRRARMECDVVHDQDTTILEDYQVRVSASTASR